LFATLDPTTRRLDLPSGQAVLLTDTVGFVRRLPHHLIDAFKATLEEAVKADFLIHLIDITNPASERHAETTLEVLRELGADPKSIVTVYNKIDLLQADRFENRRIYDGGNPIYASVKSGAGIDALLHRIDRLVTAGTHGVELLVPHARYDIVAQFHRNGHVDQEEPRDDGVYLKGSIEPRWMKPFEQFRTDARAG